ncbi:MAG: PrsW family intramembrane metalloprotease [Actinobacteria bacterium]|nr:PrsW family intramembrane metalloprotease [Actinomycetota bacterium]
MSAQPTTLGEGVPPRWGYQTSFWQRRQPAFWLFVVAVALTGFVALGKQLEMIQVAPTAWFVTLLLLLPYAIPVLLVIYLLDLYEREPLSILAAALLWGGIVATTLSLYTNTPLGELIFKFTANPTFTSEWSAALTAPFVEEGFKALGLILLVSMARAEMDDILDGFVWGAMVGLGFLLVEDVFYFVRAYVASGGSYDGLFQIFLIRILGAGPYSHFLYTGLIGMGVAFYQTRPDLPWSRRVLVGVVLAAAGIGAHFFWNSPLLGELMGDGGIVGWAMYVTAKGLPMLIGLVLVVRLARRRERKWFARLAAAQVDDGTITADEMGELGGLRSRWSARRQAGRLKGAAGGRLMGRIQRQQINLAMVESRVGTGDHADVTQQRDLVRALKAEYAALPLYVAPVPVAAAPAPGAAVQQPVPQAQPAQVAPAVPPTPFAPAWNPTHLIPDEGMMAWAAPDPSRPPVVTLGGRLELIVAERAGDWARVVAVNGWTGWVDGRRLVPRA